MVGSGFDAGGAVRRRAMRHERVPGLRGIGSALVPVFALAFAVSVAGCSGSSGPDKTFTPTATEKYVPPTPTGSADASPSAGSSPSAGEYQPATETSPAKNVPVPKYPKAARANTEEGQKAFIEYWFKTYNYAFETGDTKPMATASTKACEYCSKQIKSATEMHQEKKYWRVGKGALLTDVPLRFQSTDDYPWIVDVEIYDSPARFYSSPNVEVPNLSLKGGVRSHMRVWLMFEDDSFRLDELNLVEDGS
ncbi:MAG: DUF6318 family protein [Galactobacter sp.]|uniref:DUF6318 family protein n=1 Tax=Galactobacter sp. TaxID=2676125 RepID=UPI0025C2D99F|nr:DUF6318 family protein [Galactobacter sp.]